MTNLHESRINVCCVITNMENKKPVITNKNFLYPELSYQIQGAIFDVSNKYGKGLKESIYQKALAESLIKRGLKFEQQKRINIYSLDTGKILGTYVPDFVVEDKIILEIKASTFTTQQDVRQQQSYLKASTYEVAYLVNFCTEKLYIKRSIYTNNRKPFIVKITNQYKTNQHESVTNLHESRITNKRDS